MAPITPPVTTPSPSSAPTEPAAQTRALLHSLLLAGMTKQTKAATTVTTLSPARPSPKAIHGSQNRQPPSSHPRQQILVIDASTKVIGHGNTVTINSSPVGQQTVYTAMALMARNPRLNVELRTGVSVIGCKNTVCGLATEGEREEGKRKRKAGDDAEGEGGEEKREVKKEKVAVPV